jgi:hypothetical protein
MTGNERVSRLFPGEYPLLGNNSQGVSGMAEFLAVGEVYLDILTTESSLHGKNFRNFNLRLSVPS